LLLGISTVAMVLMEERPLPGRGLGKKAKRGQVHSLET
jgi:hypothetical protein